MILRNDLINPLLKHAFCFAILFPLFHLRLSWENNNRQDHFSLPVFGNTGSIFSLFQSPATSVLYPVGVVLNNFPFLSSPAQQDSHGQAESFTCPLYSAFDQWLPRSHSSGFLPKNALEKKFPPKFPVATLSCSRTSEHNVRAKPWGLLPEKGIGTSQPVSCEVVRPPSPKEAASWDTVWNNVAKRKTKREGGDLLIDTLNLSLPHPSPLPRIELTQERGLCYFASEE